MKKRILIVATVVKLHINVFHLPVLEYFQSLGWETHVAAKNDFEHPADCKIPFCDVYHDVDFSRSPMSTKNIQAYRDLKRIIDSNRFDVIHCHTPIGGMVGRLAAHKARKSGTKVLYTAHGFHFYKGAPYQNWLLYYPVEKFCSHFTDTLITMNQEDYRLAQRKMHAGHTYLVPGVGIDLNRFRQDEKIRKEIRREWDIPDGAFLLLSVGELNENKNHAAAIRALGRLRDENIHYVICGQGNLREELLELARRERVSGQVHLAGFRYNAPDFYCACDAFIFPSRREGLPVSLMEAMASGKPVLCSRVRGNTDLLDDGAGGLFFLPDDDKMLAEEIALLAGDAALRQEYGAHNRERISGYSHDAVMQQMKGIYGAGSPAAAVTVNER